MKIYKLEAIDCIDNEEPEYETMLIGFFDSSDACMRVETEYKKLPGFSLPSCTFARTIYDFPVSDVPCVFYVQAEKYDEQTETEDVEELGLFLTRKEAEVAKEEYLNKKSIKESIEGSNNLIIYIEEYTINQRFWQDGFIIYMVIHVKLRSVLLHHL